MTSKPIKVDSIEEAVRCLNGVLANPPGGSRLVVAIGGAVGSGKSTLASRLDGVVVATDDYLPNYAKTPAHLRDEPESSDLAGLGRDLSALKDAGAAEVPIWCFQTHQCIGTRSVAADRVIICEGIFALHPVLAASIDIRVMVSADKDARWKRWEAIEESGERGWGVAKAKRHFDEVAEPTYSKHAHLYQADLDYIVYNSA